MNTTMTTHRMVNIKMVKSISYSSQLNQFCKLGDRVRLIGYVCLC